MVHREENDEPRVGLPSLPGTYVLVLRFSKRLEIVAGKLGVLAVQPGFYVYVGSALGPGGLAARVGRHCRREKTRRWHDDYLRAEANLEEVWYAAGKSHRECQWASAFRTLPGASVPLTGFGASDCGCHPISSTSRCRLPWPIFGGSCVTRASNGCRSPMPRALRTLLLCLLDGRRLMELGGELFVNSLAEGLFDEPAGIAATRSGEPPGPNAGLALGGDGDFDDLRHAAPPWIWIVSLIEPSARVCSVH
jgi:Uri superfamily endonuclease